MKRSLHTSRSKHLQHHDCCEIRQKRSYTGGEVEALSVLFSTVCIIDRREGRNSTELDGRRRIAIVIFIFRERKEARMDHELGFFFSFAV